MRHICYVRQKVRCANEHVEVDGGGKFIAVFGAVSIVVVGVCRRKSSSPHNMGYACNFFSAGVGYCEYKCQNTTLGEHDLNV